MKSGFVLLAAMMAMEAKATLDINVQSCKIQKNIEKDQLQCPCVGGSGDYDWHFKQLPQGWKHENGRLFNDKGRFDDKKVFGAKVELFDKKTKQTLKRSLFFHFQNGQVAKAADGDYDIDIKKLAQTKNNGLNNWGLWGTAQTNNNSFVNGFDRIKKVFDGAEAIGGGGGLGKIRPFFGKGFYREENNPFVKNIPEYQEIEKAIQSEKSSNIRELVVNTVQGKNQCKNTAKFLERLFLRYRAKIAFYKDDVEKTKKNIKSTEEQIAFIEKELKKISENDVNIKTYVGQLQEFRDQAATIDNDRMKLQATLKEANQQIETMQIQIAKNIEIVNRNKKNDEIRKQNIAKIDQELAQLQSRIEKLSNQKAAFVAEADSQKVQLTQANSKIDETKVKVQAIRITISDITNKIKQLNQNYESIQSKIAATDKNIKIAGGEQSPQKLNARLADNKRKLEELKGILVKNEPVYTDYVNNYDDILLVKQNKLDECYKNIFEDDEKQFSDDEDGIKFDGREKLDKYIKKIYGKGLKNDQKILTTPADQDKPIEIKIDTKVQLPKQINLADVKIDNQKHGDKQQNKLNGRHQEDQDREKHENTIKLKRTHIFARAWTKAHGSPYDDIFDEYRGRRFAEQDQECDVASLVNTNAFSGKIVSINKNVAKVLNDQGEVCTLYLAGCTKIETANKPLPQAGDSVYWKGKEKRGKEFDTTQMTCL